MAKSTILSRLLISLLCTLVLWLIFSWPLPRYVLSGIPSSAHNVERNHVREMIAGDHLQLMYHFWLMDDMLSGKTRFFHNLYEFNTGDDDARYKPGSYYVPFSLLYALGSLLGGRSFGWNFSGFLSLWLTCYLTWCLARRYTSRDTVACIAAAISIILPYRWHALLGGSPTGFAMMWIPALCLGLDMAVRESRVAGGVLAGVALLFSSWCDGHVFFFGALVTPFWCVVAFLKRDDFQWGKRHEYIRLARALLPVPLISIAAYVLLNMLNRELSESMMSAGRSPGEVAIFSPVWQGLFSWKNLGISNQIYIGYVLPVTIIAGLVVLGLHLLSHHGPTWRRTTIAGILCIAILGLICLALGMKGPFGGRLLLLCRKIIPPYAMIRQPAKIFCLMPTFLAVASALALTSFVPLTIPKRCRIACLAVVALLITVEYRSRISPTICRLQMEQPAYQAAAKDAEIEKRTAHVLVLPLWPGDSHWSSLYQHYSSLYRIRMVNGYSPVVSKDYFENVFRKFESANKGTLSDTQLDDLQSMGVGYVILHEDAFPEKVSPLPVTFTLKQLLNTPRLRLLKQHGPIWTFKILRHPEDKAPDGTGWDSFFPSLRWEFERYPREKVRMTKDARASHGGFATLAENNSFVQTTPVRMCDAPDLRWTIRVRGNGVAMFEVIRQDEVIRTVERIIDNAEWKWIDVATGKLGGHFPVTLRIKRKSGVIDADAALLTAGKWESPSAGNSLTLLAPLFFHAGFTDLNSNRVILEPSTVPNRCVFYGPHLPLERGTYQADFNFVSPAPNGTVLGKIQIKSGDKLFSSSSVTAGATASLHLEQEDNLPIRFMFTYSREGRIEIENVVLTKLSEDFR